jgi:beta-lactam-binding protein with PASTA domain
MPQLSGLTLTQALRLLEQESMQVEVESVGRIVEDQIPQAGSSLKDTQRVYLRLKD